MIINNKLISVLKYLSLKGNVFVYGGSSISIRLYLKEKVPYRLSKDIDISKLLTTEEAELNLNKSIGPKSQFKPLDIKEYLKEEYGDSNVIVKDNTSSSPIQLIIVNEDKEDGGIVFELMIQKKSNSHQIENINEINFQKLSKVYADKIFALLQYFSSGELEDSNNIRHLIDLMLIPSELKFNIKINDNLKKETIFFLKERISNENTWINNNLNSKESKILTRINERKYLIDNFHKIWVKFMEEYLINGIGKNKFLDINNKLKENTYMMRNFKNIVNESRVSYVSIINRGLNEI